MQALRATQSALRKVQLEQIPTVLDTDPRHPFNPGDFVYVKRFQAGNLEPRWKGPYPVISVTPTALKVEGVGPWVHHTHVKQAKGPWKAYPDVRKPLKLKLRRVQYDTPEA